jgi:hypothetical protein
MRQRVGAVTGYKEEEEFARGRKRSKDEGEGESRRKASK